MEVLSVTQFSRNDLLSSMRRVRLRGFDGATVYRKAQIEIVEALDPHAVLPAQNYVLRRSVERVGELRAALRKWGVDPLALNGGAYIRTADDPSTTLTVVPPVIEESVEPDGQVCLLVCDGLHRMFYAHAHNMQITALVVRRATHPYYAFPLAGGWDDVELLDSLPTTYQKKVYRHPDNYKALFRDFNGVFPNVQSQRLRSNPSSLQPGAFAVGDGYSDPANREAQ